MEKSSSSVELKTKACDKMKKKKQKHLFCVMSYYEVMVWGGVSYVTG